MTPSLERAARALWRERMKRHGVTCAQEAEAVWALIHDIYEAEARAVLAAGEEPKPVLAGPDKIAREAAKVRAKRAQVLAEPSRHRRP